LGAAHRPGFDGQARFFAGDIVIQNLVGVRPADPFEVISYHRYRMLNTLFSTEDELSSSLQLVDTRHRLTDRVNSTCTPCVAVLSRNKARFASGSPGAGWTVGTVEVSFACANIVYFKTEMCSPGPFFASQACKG